MTLVNLFIVMKFHYGTISWDLRIRQKGLSLPPPLFRAQTAGAAACYQNPVQNNNQERKTMILSLPYDLGHQNAALPDARVQAVLAPRTPQNPSSSQQEIVAGALRNPINSEPLSVLARAAKRVLILSSDHTRPVPSKLLMPQLLGEIRKGNPAAEIKTLIATGCHRPSTADELAQKYGRHIADTEEIVNHISTNTDEMVDKGYLPSGGRLRLNRLVDWADLIVGEGFIEPHFFAGFSGGRKSILPGIAAAETVVSNHCAALIAHPKARTGILQGNPIHADMLFAAEAAKLGFILNVALDHKKQIVSAWAGHFQTAHEAGCAYVRKYYSVPMRQGDIVITSNGGYPLDQNVYQAVKCMTAAESCVRQNGVIIVSAACRDGIGGDSFFKQSSRAMRPQAIIDQFLTVPADQTEPDQWQTQIFMRVLSRATVIMVTDPSLRQDIERMHMRYAPTLEEAIRAAETIVPGGRCVVIPDGVSVIVEDRPDHP